MKKHIPNILTLGNLFSGCMAIYHIMHGDLLTAAWFVAIGAGCDVFDGLVARALGVSSPIGAQLDSLADMVTFGVVPAFIARAILVESSLFAPDHWVLYVPFILALFSALRLAKFNVDERQVSGFIGLPTPANALFWLSLVLVKAGYYGVEELPFWMPPLLFNNGYLILTLCVVFSLLMVSELPLLALKFNGWGFQLNRARYTLIIVSVVLFSIYLFAAIPIILLLYLIISLIHSQTLSNEV